MRKIVIAVIGLVFGLSQLLTLQHCANPLPPQGGPRDTIGPVVVPETSTPPFQTNFRPDRIELTFDEWVQLKNPGQIVISPPIDPAPKPSLKKRTLILDFGEAVLRENATYVVNIGEAVVDLNEGNPPDNLRFVFATGPVLDSAAVRGQLVDAYTAEPVEDALFALYENLADTAVQTENPFYFAKADEEGNFEISNIRPGTYRAIALDNGGLGGYRYDRSTAQVGFLDSLLVIPDSTLNLGAVRLSPVPEPLRLLARDTTDFGRVKITFDRPAEKVALASQQTYLRINEKDTLSLFYQEAAADVLVFGVDSVFVDTFLLARTNRTEPRRPLVLRKQSSRSFNPLKEWFLTFNRPIAALDTNLINLREDTLSVPLGMEYRIDSLQATQLLFKKRWREGVTYEMELLPGAVTDMYGLTQPDTITATVKVEALTNYGSLTLQITGLDTSSAYIFRLVEGSNRDLREALFAPAGSSSFSATLPGLKPTTYQLEVITDRNGNQQYDGGDWERQRQPEDVRIYPVEALRANWEVEAIINAQVAPPRTGRNR